MYLNSKTTSVKNTCIAIFVLKLFTLIKLVQKIRKMTFFTVLFD